MTITTNSFDFDRTKPVKPNRNVRMAIAACAGVLAVAAVLVVGGGDNSTSAVEHMRTQSEYTQHLVDTYQIPAATLSNDASSDAYTQHLVDTYQIPAATLQG